MQKIMLTSKLHRATVTDRNIEYEGSIAIDEALMEEVGISSYEQVHIYDINNGNRLITYAIPGERGSGVISVNGAAARLVERNDRIIIAAYGMINVDKRDNYEPRILLLDEKNNIVERQGALAFNSQVMA
ncbi:MAG: aspartate 1-decarboxylase [Nitrospinaceae bacterium]|nr:aspartate 1-decarboxylase [Nitrospinaceae bacterium]NIR56148.1 aspartate 1-decarboxylase [Nitrospinaceae bacterium]NIS86603.1 aspartate 1-decarboxylase [Nitrospinaceae bacterium]NIT83433.1 aspartate 1-decarboxylase [Nitrospinaceae bacterium]NIU45642.1 aspartate 1-decarboxylase [Nitrospinaceae bacterium]